MKKSVLYNPVFLYIWYSNIFAGRKWPLTALIFCVLFLWEWFVHRNDELWLHVGSRLPGLGGLWTSGCRVTKAALAWEHSAFCLIRFYMHYLHSLIFVNKLTRNYTKMCCLCTTIWMEMKVYLQDVDTLAYTHTKSARKQWFGWQKSQQLTSVWVSDFLFPVAWSEESCAFCFWLIVQKALRRRTF